MPCGKCGHNRPGPEGPHPAESSNLGGDAGDPDTDPTGEKVRCGGARESLLQKGRLKEPRKTRKGAAGRGLSKGCVRPGRRPPRWEHSRRLPLVLLLLLLLPLVLRQPVLPQHGLEVHVGLPLVQVLELLQVL